MKTVCTIVSDLKDENANDIVFSMVIEGEPRAIEGLIMAQAKIRFPTESGSIYIDQRCVKAATFGEYQEPAVIEEE
jgi:hypothetical protein